MYNKARDEEGLGSFLTVIVVAGYKPPNVFVAEESAGYAEEL